MARLNQEQAEARCKRIRELRPVFNELIPKYRTARGTDNIGIAMALNERGELNLMGNPWSKTDVSNFTARDLVDKGPQSATHPNDMAQREPWSISAVDTLEIFGVAVEIEEPDSPFSETLEEQGSVSPIISRVAIPRLVDDTVTNDMPTVDREPVTTLPPESEPATYNIPTRGIERAPLPDDLVELLTSAHESGALAELLEWWHSTKGEHPMAPTRPRFVGKRVNSGLLINEGLKNRAFAKAKLENLSLSQLVEILFWRYVGEPQDCLGE